MTMPSEPAPEVKSSTREAILEAAVQEFVERGYDGVRLEHVARRANCNKALLYRYFGDREKLFAEALRHQFSKRQALLDRLPAGLDELLVWWTKITQRDPVFVKLMLREAFEYDGDIPVEAGSRTKYYRQQISLLRDLQDAGVIDEKLDKDMLFLALLSIIALPSLLPQVVWLVCGHDATSPEFGQRWSTFLESFALQLRPKE